ncbi:MAG: hypothetical protein NT027_17850, partial [Proteobacteria bacterium]|nr:hypothetical protein [Pseudomonadota bacterium]
IRIIVEFVLLGSVSLATVVEAAGQRPVLPLALQQKTIEKKTLIKGMNPKDKKSYKKELVKVPFTKVQLRQNYLAKIEAEALIELNQRANFAKSVKLYENLSKELLGSRQGGAIDLRILEICKTQYQKNGLPTIYQRNLIKFLDRYKDSAFLGQENIANTQRIYAFGQRMHMDLVQHQVKLGLAKKTSRDQRKLSISVIDAYLELDTQAQERVALIQNRGEIQYLGEDHNGAVSTFAGLASGKDIERTKVNVSDVWRKAIRSQNILAKWPSSAPWTGAVTGFQTQREVLLGFYSHLSKDATWAIWSHIGLLHYNLGRTDEAYKVLGDYLSKAPNGVDASYASGLLAHDFMSGKFWQRSEDLGRLMQRSSLTGRYGKNTYKGRDVLGISLLEGGLEKYSGSDFKTAVLKLNEFVKGWSDHNRYDQGYYHLAMAYHGGQNYKYALDTMVEFCKTFQKSKYRRDALVNGGSWSTSMAWEDHVMYFYEAHAREFPDDAQVLNSLDVLANLYMGREHYDAATRIMLIQLSQRKLGQDVKIDIARRLLDVNERQGSPESSERVANMTLKSFSDVPAIKATALSMKARIKANDDSGKILSVAKDLLSMDSSDKTVSEAQAEVRFLIAESLSRGAFDKQIFSLESRNPLNDLNKFYALYDKIRIQYESACSVPGSSWCGPAMHRLARISDEFVESVSPLEIPQTLEPSLVQSFNLRKKSIIETAERKVILADERSLVEAKAGATNPDWTGAILWQNSAEWQSDRVTGEAGNGFVQWHNSSAN